MAGDWQVKKTYCDRHPERLITNDVGRLRLVVEHLTNQGEDVGEDSFDVKDLCPECVAMIRGMFGFKIRNYNEPPSLDWIDNDVRRETDGAADPTGALLPSERLATTDGSPAKPDRDEAEVGTRQAWTLGDDGDHLVPAGPDR